MKPIPLAILLILLPALLPAKTMLPENRERLVIVGAGYTEGHLAGIELGFNLRFGNLVFNSYYDPPVDRTAYNLSFLTETINHDGEFKGQVSDGILYINARWLMPVYRSLWLSGSIGLASARQINIYRDATYDYHYGVLSHEQSANAGAGLTWRPIKNLAVNYEYNYRLGSMISLNYYWVLNEPAPLDE